MPCPHSSTCWYIHHALLASKGQHWSDSHYPWTAQPLASGGGHFCQLHGCCTGSLVQPANGPGQSILGEPLLLRSQASPETAGERGTADTER